jgi:hypothetical protein
LVGVADGVGVGAFGSGVGDGVGVGVGATTVIDTLSVVAPNRVEPLAICHCKLFEPSVWGTMSGTENVTCAPGETEPASGNVAEVKPQVLLPTGLTLTSL